MLPDRKTKFFSATVYTGYVVSLFLSLEILFSGIAAGQGSSAASLDTQGGLGSTGRLRPVSSPQSYRAQARYLLRNSAFYEALEMYRKELRSSPDDASLVQEYEMLKKILQQAGELQQTKDAVQWRLIALQLSNYYRNNGVNREYLAIALLMYRKSQDQTDVLRVLDAYRRLGKHEDAINFTNTLYMPENTVKMYKASVYLAADEVSKARTLARSVQTRSCNPEELMQLARIQAATGLLASAVKTLKTCFESAPEEMLIPLKHQAQNCEEFDDIRDSDEFKAAMRTESLANAPGYTPPCARRWVGTKIDETPAYIRNFKSKEINFNDWHVKP
ncbi:MAG: hypothetical protein FWE67_02965 [Planctomycetaceae bacterium]|nr:hypothetical protein [Planctomycetaceae bacterium]